MVTFHEPSFNKLFIRLSSSKVPKLFEFATSLDLSHLTNECFRMENIKRYLVITPLMTVVYFSDKTLNPELSAVTIYFIVVCPR